jgi:hypothetical protein
MVKANKKEKLVKKEKVKEDDWKLSIDDLQERGCLINYN